MDNIDKTSVATGEINIQEPLGETIPSHSVTVGIVVPILCGTDASVRYRDGIINKDSESVPVETRTYRRRFWILFIFSLTAFYQSMLWNTWGPISASIPVAFPGWTPGTTAMLSNWGAICLVAFIFPMSWFMNVQGIRNPMVICVALFAIGTIMRCFPEESLLFIGVSNMCAILVGISGTMIMCGAAMIPAIWFPPKERTTAIAVIIAASQLGVTGSYLEPLVVDDPGSLATPDEIKWTIKRLMTIEAAISVAILIAVVAYFPDRPPHPPSLSSSQERLKFLPSLGKMIRNKDLMLLFLSFATACGVVWSWVGVLNYSLVDLNIDQNGAMKIGLAMTFMQTVSGVAAGRLTDMMYGHLKTTLVVSILVTCGFAYWFGLLLWDTVPRTDWQIYCSILGLFSINFAIMPLFIQYSVEMAYPCPEQIVLAAMYTFLGLFSAVFLILFSIVHTDSYVWMVYCLLGFSSFSIFPLLVTKENYARTKVDDSTHRETTRNIIVSM